MLRHSGPVCSQLHVYKSLQGFLFPTFSLLPIHPSIHLTDPKSHTKPTITDIQIGFSLKTSTIMSDRRGTENKKRTDGYVSGRNTERDRMRELLKDNDIEEPKEDNKMIESQKREGRKSEGHKYTYM